MYYLLLELPALRQLKATRVEWAGGIERGLEGICARYRVSEVDRTEDFRLYALPPVHQGSVQELLACVTETESILEEVKEDLLGYTLLLHRTSATGPRDILRELKERLLPVAFEDGLWFTEEAASQLRTLCELSREPGTDLLKVESMAHLSATVGRPLEEVVCDRDERKGLLKEIKRISRTRKKGARSALHLTDGSDGTLRWALRCCLQESRIPWLEAEHRSLYPCELSLRSIPALGAPWSAGEAEDHIDGELRAFEKSAINRGSADLARGYTDRPEAELKELWREAVLLLLSLSERGLLLCFETDRWSAEEVSLLEEILNDADPEGQLAIVSLASGEAPAFRALPVEWETATWELPAEAHLSAVLAGRANGAEGGAPSQEPEGLGSFFESLEERELMLLFLHGSFSEHLSPPRLEQLAGRLGFSPVEYRRSIDRFFGDGLLWERPNGTLLLLDRWENELAGVLEVATRNRVSRLVGTELLHLYQRGELEQRPELFPTILFAADDSDQERLVRDYLWARLPRFDEGHLEQWLFGFDALSRDRLRRLTRIFGWRAALCYAGEPGELPFREVGSGGILEAEYELAMAEEHYIKGLLQKSLQTSKRALAQFLALSDHHGRTRAYLQLALVAMGRGELQDAAAYLGYATKSSADARDDGLRIFAESLRAVVDMVQGNFSRVAQETPELSRRASAASLRERETFVTFLYGRSLFELGRTEEAERAFAATERLSRTEETRELARRWVWRAFQAGREIGSREAYLPPPRERGSRELQLFGLERAVLTGEEPEDPGEPRTIPPFGAPGFHPLYRLDWSTGFASVEDLVDFSNRRTLDLLLYGLQCWQEARSGDLMRARSNLRWLTREAPVSPSDPSRQIHLYLYSRVLPREAGGESDDRSTVLGKAIKLLQERTARLDRSGDKERYLNNNQWNGAIMREGRHLNIC